MTEPKWLSLARAELGVKEAPGEADNPAVVRYYADAGHPEIAHDATAWCAAFLGAVLKRSGIAPSGSLMARSYLKWGEKLDAPKVGCIAVLWRGSPTAETGHVGFYLGGDDHTVTLLGGNQGDAVSIVKYERSRVLDFRWPKEDVRISAQPQTQQTGRTTGMFPQLLTALISVVLPKSAPGTPSTGVVIAPSAAHSNLLSIVVGAVLTGVGATSFGADAIHTLSALAGVALVALSWLNHMGLVGSSNSNTEALIEDLLRQVAEAGQKQAGTPKA